MSKTLKIFDKTFSNVKGFKAKDLNGGDSNYSGYPEYKWLRPEGWPDIDSLVPWTPQGTFSDFDGCYFTYDNTGHNFTIFAMACKTNSGQWVTERGHVINGEFITDETFLTNSNTALFYDYKECGYLYPVFYVHATTGNHITECYYKNFSDTQVATYGLQSKPYGTDSPCIERAGHLGYVDHLGGNGSEQLNNRYLVRDHLVWGDKVVVTTLQQAWANCGALKEIDFSYWDTRNWEVTTMNQTFTQCGELRCLDFSKLDVSKWNITNWNYTFNNCGRLQYLDLTGFEDSENNEVATNYMQYIFNGCTGCCFAKVSALTTSITSGSVSYPKGGALVDYYPMSLYISQNYNSCCALSHASILRILNSLPELNEGDSRTVTFDRGLKAKLSSEDIAIATNKGWTVG